jgi:undecaprenyl-diphosphatase
MNTLDRNILLALRNTHDHHDPLGPEWLEQMALDITSLGGYTVLTALVGLVAGFLLLADRRASAALLVVTALSAIALSNTLKLLVARPRPDLVEHLVTVTSPSFPSGHALMSATIYLTLGALLARNWPQPSLRRYFMTVATVLALLIGVSRVYLGVHWPSDVLVGWCLGGLWAWGCWRLLPRLQQRWPPRPLPDLRRSSQ